MQGLQGPQPWRLLLLLKAQCILYRRYGHVLQPFKYAGYPMLLDAVTVDTDDNNFLSNDRAPLLVAASELVSLTYLLLLLLKFCNSSFLYYYFHAFNVIYLTYFIFLLFTVSAVLHRH